MMQPARSHDDYVRFVRRRLRKTKIPFRHRQVPAILQQLDLTPAVPLLHALYCEPKGRPARPPEDLFRSLVAMMLCGFTSIDAWVCEMRDRPFFAHLSGFRADDTPGVGTFYDFFDRLVGLDLNPVRHLLPPPRARQQKEQDQQAAPDKNQDTKKHEGICDRLAQRCLRLAQDSPPPPEWRFLPERFCRAERVLQGLFYLCVVRQSIQHGLIDLNALYLAGDGSKMSTWANPRGTKQCSCDNQNKPREERCSCERYYRDPEARWGYDSHSQGWVFGHSVYELTAFSFDHTCQLPVVILMAANNRHDSLLSLLALHRAADTLGFPVQVATFDKASDVTALYQLADQLWHTSLVIPLHERHPGSGNLPEGFSYSDHGTPVCPQGCPMTHWGYCPDKSRRKWRCSCIAGKQSQRQAGCRCSPSPYGRVLYTYPDRHLRLDPPIPRSSPTWQKFRRAHSCVERTHKRKKYDFQLNQTKTAGRGRWFIRVMLAAICQHLVAWHQHLPLAA